MMETRELTNGPPKQDNNTHMQTNELTLTGLDEGANMSLLYHCEGLFDDLVFLRDQNEPLFLLFLLLLESFHVMKREKERYKNKFK